MICIATDDLYRDGVQRDRFIPFIYLLKAVGVSAIESRRAMPGAASE